MVSGFTNTRTSRPAEIAYDFSTPGKEFAIPSMSARRLIYCSTESPPGARGGPPAAARAAPPPATSPPPGGGGGGGPPAGNGVGNLHNVRLCRFVRVFLVMGLHGFDDLLLHAELLEYASPNLDVRALHLVVECFADVMQERAGAGDGRIGADFLGYHAGDVRHLYRVL